jgi:NAD(P)-dependent dehydrogenase (short-subunit alcohol dehydrogenase family)
MNTGLSGKSVIITGGASGIGRASAAAFATEHAHVVVIDHDADRASETVAECHAHGAQAHAVVGDLSTGPGVNDSMTTAIAHCDGAVDVLVNNVGSGAVRTFDDIDDTHWHDTFELNFMSYVRATRAVLPIMRRRGGAIINNASDLARQPEPNPIDYAASKAAVLALTTGLARAEAPYIRVNAVAPGPVWTPFWTKPGGFAETLAEVHQLPPAEAVAHEMSLRQLPLGRLGRPDEVAAVILFLASDLASFVTSSVWGVDGGSIRGIS